MSGVPLEDGSVRTPLVFDQQIQDTEGHEVNTRLQQTYSGVHDRYSYFHFS